MQHAPKKPRVFSFWGKGGEGWVLNFLISCCSHQDEWVSSLIFHLWFSNGKNYTRVYKNVHSALHFVFIFGKLLPILNFFKKHSYHYKEKMGGNFIFNRQKNPITNGMDPKMLTIDLRITILYFKPFVNVVKWSHWRLSISSNCYIFVVKVSTCFLWTSFVYCVQELAKTSFKSDCFFCPMVVSCNGLSPTCLGVLLYSHLIMPALALGLTTKGKTWEGSRLEECSKIQTRSHKVARMSSNTFKWFFSL